MIRPAATVVLVRETADDIEVLMMRRGERLAFLGGLWVFPGGRVEAVDRSPEALAVIPDQARAAVGEVLETLDGRSLSPEHALGPRVAACRETFEEAGVLLARDARGAACEPELVARLQPRRAEVVADPAAFVRMLAGEQLFLDVAPLVHWSHWITPSVEARRFDTHFYVVPLPAGQAASADMSELTEHAWMSPAAVGAAYERGELRMVPPTLLTLEDLIGSHADHGNLGALLAAERRRETPPIMPRVETRDDSWRVVMPWDTGYREIAGEGCPITEPLPPHLARLRSSVALPRPRNAGA